MLDARATRACTYGQRGQRERVSAYGPRGRRVHLRWNPPAWHSAATPRRTASWTSSPSGWRFQLAQPAKTARWSAARCLKPPARGSLLRNLFCACRKPQRSCVARRALRTRGSRVQLQRALRGRGAPLRPAAPRCAACAQRTHARAPRPGCSNISVCDTSCARRSRTYRLRARGAAAPCADGRLRARRGASRSRLGAHHGSRGARGGARANECGTFRPGRCVQTHGPTCPDVAANLDAA